jgi:hypothetical protein
MQITLWTLPSGFIIVSKLNASRMSCWIANNLLLRVTSQATERTHSYKLGELIATKPVATERTARRRYMGSPSQVIVRHQAGEAAIASDGLAMSRGMA